MDEDLAYLKPKYKKITLAQIGKFFAKEIKTNWKG
jgi:hypothetical protein